MSYNVVTAKGKMGFINNLLMTAAIKKSLDDCAELVAALNKSTDRVRSLAATAKHLRATLGAANDRLAVARAERDGYRALALRLISEVKGDEPALLTAPEAGQRREAFLQETYSASLAKYEAELLRSYRALPEGERRQLLDNEVRRKGRASS